MTLPVIAIANGGNATPRSSYSTAPTTTWTAGGNMDASGRAWQAIAYSPTLNLFVAVQNAGIFAADHVIAYSTAGTAWTNVPSSSIDSSSTTWDLQDICWSDTLGLFVAVASAGPTTTKRILTSSNGTTWAAHVLPDASKILRGVAWSKELGLLVAVGNSNAIYHSADGSTWTLASSLPGTSKTWISIAWGGDGAGGGVQKFMAIASGAGGVLDDCYSSDGSSWTQSQVGPGSGYSWLNIAYSPQQDRFVVVGGNTGVLNYTTTGSVTAWTQINTGLGSNLFQDICWSKDLSMWVGVSNSTTVLTSSNGTTWATNTNIAASQNWNAIVAGITTTVTETGAADMTMPAFTQDLAGISGAGGDIAMTMVLFSMDLEGAVLAADIGMVMPLFSMDAEGVVEQSVIGMVMPLFSMDLAGMSGPYGIIDQLMPMFRQTMYGEQLQNPGNEAFYSWWFLGD